MVLILKEFDNLKIQQAQKILALDITKLDEL